MIFRSWSLGGWPSLLRGASFWCPRFRGGLLGRGGRDGSRGYGWAAFCPGRWSKQRQGVRWIPVWWWRAFIYYYKLNFSGLSFSIEMWFFQIFKGPLTRKCINLNGIPAYTFPLLQNPLPKSGTLKTSTVLQLITLKYPIKSCSIYFPNINQSIYHQFQPAVILSFFSTSSKKYPLRSATTTTPWNSKNLSDFPRPCSFIPFSISHQKYPIIKGQGKLSRLTLWLW